VHTLNRDDAKKTNSRSLNQESGNYKCLKNLQINGRCKGKSQARATAERNISYLWSSYLFEYMMATNHDLFEGDRE